MCYNEELESLFRYRTQVVGQNDAWKISTSRLAKVLPGYHREGFHIERSLTIEALSEVRVLGFTVLQFREMFEASVFQYIT